MTYADDEEFTIRGMIGLWPRFGLYNEAGDLVKVFWGWSATHATIRAVRYVRRQQ